MYGQQTDHSPTRKAHRFSGVVALLLQALCLPTLVITQAALAGSIDLRWDPAIGDDRVVGYEVHYGLSPGTYGWLVDANTDGANTSTRTVSNLVDGQTYYFAVRARNNDGSLVSVFSNEIGATVPQLATLLADFTANRMSGAAPLAVVFTDTSSGNVTERVWNFGDGGSGSGQTAVHEYRNQGTYDVTLTVNGSGGGSDSEIKLSYITVSSGSGGSLDGLVAAYAFEGADDLLVVDDSGNNNDGILSGASRISAGRFGNAVSFDGVDDWITVDDADSLDLSDGMTLEAWVYPTALGGWNTILMKETAGDLAYALYANDNAPRPAAYLRTNAISDVPGSSAVPLNTWTHVAVTYDGAVMRLYVNGSAVGAQALVGNVVASSRPLRIGGNETWMDEFFKGRIDEVRIYNRALSLAEIRSDSTTPLIDVSEQSCSGENVTVSSIVFSAGDYNCYANVSLETNGDVVVQFGASVTFNAPTTALGPGFRVAQGGQFQAGPDSEGVSR